VIAPGFVFNHGMARFRVDPKLPTWRRVALSTWRRGDDPTIYGWLDLDATALQAYVQKLRDKTGQRITLTHIIGKAAAMAFAAHPENNGIPSLGRFKQRDTVDVFFRWHSRAEGTSRARRSSRPTRCRCPRSRATSKGRRHRSAK